MGDRTDKVWKSFAHEGPMIYWANILVTAACLLDYYFSDRTWEIETLAALIFLINGFALWNRKNELNKAYKLERDDMVEAARSDAARTERLKSRGLI
ncbi:hypothetical protein UP09_02200 [Bradyrhizobium sp. LTSP885]|uniref:hypothetical protein n=1 Tax=Bradyrhizobium sp. LTSP885 TaxID=1619232 RepID=UPI0005C84F0E|nr:hypothetical protein [Bradyrhizobium sp. LTSP885]KJC51721.1 hypothetical protein UP09_02200 [Bradyrhizobium sp. LTSP885]